MSHCHTLKHSSRKEIFLAALPGPVKASPYAALIPAPHLTNNSYAQLQITPARDAHHSGLLQITPDRLPQDLDQSGVIRSNLEQSGVKLFFPEWGVLIRHQRTPSVIFICAIWAICGSKILVFLARLVKPTLTGWRQLAPVGTGWNPKSAPNRVHPNQLEPFRTMNEFQVLVRAQDLENRCPSGFIRGCNGASPRRPRSTSLRILTHPYT